MNKDNRYVKAVNPVKSIRFYQPNKTLKPIKPINFSNFTKEIYTTNILETNKQIFSELKKRIKEKTQIDIKTVKDELKNFKIKTNLNKFLTKPVEIEKVFLKEEKKDLIVEDKEKKLDNILKEIPPIVIKDEIISLPEEGYYLLLKYGNYDLDKIVSDLLEKKYSLLLDEKNLNIAKNYFLDFINNRNIFVTKPEEIINLSDELFTKSYNIAFAISKNKSYKTVMNLANEIFNVLKVLKLKQVMLFIKDMVLEMKHPYYKNYSLQEGLNFVDSYANFLMSDKANRVIESVKKFGDSFGVLSNLNEVSRKMFDVSMFDFFAKLSSQMVFEKISNYLGISFVPNILTALASIVNLVINLKKQKEFNKILSSDIKIIDENGKYIQVEQATKEIEKIKKIFGNDVEKAKIVFSILSIGHFLNELIGLINSFKVLSEILFAKDYKSFDYRKINIIV